MEHILNIAFNFDDDKVRKVAENAVENEMNSIIKGIVTDKIAPMSSGWYPNKERDWSRLWDGVDRAIGDMLADHREEIIELAADKLVKSARSTKAWRSKFSEIVENE